MDQRTVDELEKILHGFLKMMECHDIHVMKKKSFRYYCENHYVLQSHGSDPICKLEENILYMNAFLMEALTELTCQVFSKYLNEFCHMNRFALFASTLK